MNSVQISLLQEQLEGLAQEMGCALARAAFSPNIRVRLDFSCALFTAEGDLLAQAAHIPVHLGSMPTQVQRLASSRQLKPGQLYLGNDPFDGGTHLPDLTLLEPIFAGDRCVAIAAVRAHHADIGGTVPGSMSSQSDIYGEGLRVPLLLVAEDGIWNAELMKLLLANMRSPSEREGDLLAQSAACRAAREGIQRIVQQWAGGDVARWQAGQQALLDSSEALTRTSLARLFEPGSVGEWSDVLECPIAGESVQVPISVKVALDSEGCLTADFAGTSPAVAASFNATLPVTQAALAYVVSCLLDEPVAINQGLLRCLTVEAPLGCLVQAQYPSAVAAGNVETSQRIVDVIFGAFSQLLPNRVPAASAGSMNNLSFGFSGAVHYETAGGGSGAHPDGPGNSGLQVHMTNTRSTPHEVLEQQFPVLVLEHRFRANSGGAGLHSGGDGTSKLLEFQQAVNLSLMSTRRTTAPYGLAGGLSGMPGRQAIRTSEGDDWQELPASFSTQLPAGAQFRLETPGGGGWGTPLSAGHLPEMDSLGSKASFRPSLPGSLNTAGNPAGPGEEGTRFGTYPDLGGWGRP